MEVIWTQIRLLKLLAKHNRWWLKNLQKEINRNLIKWNDQIEAYNRSKGQYLITSIELISLNELMPPYDGLKRKSVLNVRHQTLIDYYWICSLELYFGYWLTLNLIMFQGVDFNICVCAITVIYYHHRVLNFVLNIAWELLMLGWRHWVVDFINIVIISLFVVLIRRLLSVTWYSLLSPRTFLSPCDPYLNSHRRAPGLGL